MKVSFERVMMATKNRGGKQQDMNQICQNCLYFSETGKMCAASMDFEKVYDSNEAVVL